MGALITASSLNSATEKRWKRKSLNMEFSNMYECEDRAFLDSTVSGEKNAQQHLDDVLESAKLLDVLYKLWPGIKREIEVK